MPCCGSRRAALSFPSVRRRDAAVPAPPLQVEVPIVQRTLRYRGPAPMLLAGAVSGTVYELYRADGEVQIDVRDEPALRATGWFE